MKIIGSMVIYLILQVYPSKVKIVALNAMCFVFVLVIANNSYQMIRVIFS